MPIKKRVYKKRKAPARRRRAAGPPRSLRPNHQVATVVETLDPQSSFLDNLAINQSTYLLNFKRCIQMTTLYEQFRIEEVAYTYSPLWNTFQESSGTASSVPVFYSVMDRLQSLNPSTTSLTDLVQMGARRRLFTKPITIRYRPNTMVTTGVASPASPGQILQINGADYGRWFPCTTQNVGSQQNNTPNTLSAHTQIYNGHWVYFQQDSGANVQPAATVAITIRVSFKNPLVNETPPPTVVAWKPLCGPREIRTLREIGADSPFIELPAPT